MAKGSLFKGLCHEVEAQVLPALAENGAFNLKDDPQFGVWNPSIKDRSWLHFMRPGPGQPVKLHLWVISGPEPEIYLDATCHAVDPALEDQAVAQLLRDTDGTADPNQLKRLRASVSPRHLIGQISQAPADWFDRWMPKSVWLRALAAPVLILLVLVGWVISLPFHLIIRTPLPANKAAQQMVAALPDFLRRVRTVTYDTPP